MCRISIPLPSSIHRHIRIAFVKFYAYMKFSLLTYLRCEFINTLFYHPSMIDIPYEILIQEIIFFESGKVCCVVRVYFDYFLLCVSNVDPTWKRLKHFTFVRNLKMRQCVRHNMLGSELNEISIRSIRRYIDISSK